MILIEKAQQFAHEAHDEIKQVRKYTGEPYWVHTDEVAQIVFDTIYPLDYTGMYDDGQKVIDARKAADEIVAAAHLHDVEEDVMPSKIVIPNPERYGLSTDGVYYYDVTAIALIFGTNVARYVLELTDVFTKENHPNLNRAQRKLNERKRIGQTSPEAKTIKLADLLSNTKSIVEHDKDFAHTYLREKFELLPYLADGSPELLQRASIQCLVNMEALGIKVPILNLI